MNDNVPHKETASEAEEDAASLDDAAAILRARFGVLYAGDLITGLTSAAASIRARGGIIRPVEADPEVTRIQRNMDLFAGPGEDL
jgi:hypothetical protein